MISKRLPSTFDFKYLKLGNVCLDVIYSDVIYSDVICLDVVCSVAGLVVDAVDHFSVDSRSVITLLLWPQPSRRAGRPSCTCGLREILLLSQFPPAAAGLIEPARVASCSSALFAAVHGGSLGPSSLSVISLIALKVKRENQNPVFDLDVKSTFELPNEEWR
ncbi:TPA: hypothetical protein ACV1O4_002596 [Yersinia enterocolitica]|uniref:hypothetical protein n=2 Tax=Yersinia enterocolitica TaxID=630 RepID=UPI0005E2EDAA|nr:hypothetical protein [Yersinia enterocolitica]EKN3573896.1 hypothetical protein [Yersinia enterocolitica]EKN3579607.1 hypothetical protein [Yersinia enterocolitica]EKN3596058.1 hypothetical protein [Yersinia enterocolitica]EKN4024495.1 hypothetical protein [Yersinia enterocolitica]EKN4087970.1 hypothetical protein [Yersinia enterocolitica]